MGNKIWIELEHPSTLQDATAAGRLDFANEQCRLANNMLTRLADPAHLPLRDTFFYSAHERCYGYGGHMGYVTLPDHGHWLNLDYLGRPIAVAPKPVPLEELIGENLSDKDVRHD